jgi:hypothetical protein
MITVVPLIPKPSVKEIIIFKMSRSSREITFIRLIEVSLYMLPTMFTSRK